MKAPNTSPDSAVLLDRILTMYRLKSLPRQGWLDAGIPVAGAESVAAHSFGCALLVLLLEEPLRQAGASVEHCLRLAVIHDLAESQVGDITPHDPRGAGEKHLLELAAMEDLFKNLDSHSMIGELWLEFEAGETPEAALVRRIDKLDMLIQALFYGEQGHDLDEFFSGMDDLYASTVLDGIFNSIKQRYFGERRGQ